MAIWGEIAQAGGGILSGIASGLFNANQAAKNRKFQERMYNKQYQDSIDFWKMQNEYALPSAELQRLKDAGLNPLLYYSGQGVSSQGAAPALPSQPSGSQASANFDNPFAGFGIMDAQRKMLEAQSRNMDTGSEKNLADALKSWAESRRISKEGKKLETEIDFNIRSMEDRLNILHTENRLKETMSNLNEWQVDEIKKGLEKVDKDMEYLDNMIENNTRMTDQQIQESKQRVKNSISELAQKIKLMKAEERKALADAWLAREQARTESQVRDKVIEEYQAKIDKLIREGDAQELENIMNAYAFDKMPAPGSGAWKYQKWIENYVNPVTSALGNIIGGALGGSAAAMIKKGK